MRKIIIGLLIGLIAVSVFASETRRSVLNLGGYVCDMIDCWDNPGLLINYHTDLGKDAVGMEFGFDNAPNNADMNRWGYLHYGTPGVRYLGVAVNRPFNQRLLPFRNTGFNLALSQIPGFADLALDTLQAPHNLLDVIYSTKMGQAGVGINMNFGMWGMDGDSAQYTADLSSMKFGLLAGYHTPTLSFTLGLDYLTASAEMTDTLTALSSEKLDVSGMHIYGGFKYVMYPNQNTDIILPRVGVDYWTGNGTFTQAGTASITWDPEMKGTDMMITLGSGIVWHGNTWLAGLAGEVGYRMEKATYTNETANNIEREESENTMIIPRVRAGAESRVFSWLTARAGMTYQLHMVNEKDETTVAGTSATVERNEKFWRNMNMQIGLGVHFGPNFTLDAEVSEDLLYNGPYLLSGANNGTNPMNLCISATYTF
ncbi:MAG: hypothetical protein APR63_14875 [Desulfuromonas sp. SDB]|nr:MAG: hypothetical protein APR63_14875 [Desulfuromonas sp. SDB]